MSAGRLGRCASCTGRACDDDALAKVVDAAASSSIQALAHEVGALTCPQCRHAMVEGRRRGVVVDRCASCGITWFDAHESAAFAEGLSFHESGRSDVDDLDDGWSIRHFVARLLDL